MPDINVRFNPDRSRWEALLNGDEIGFLDYQVNCGIVEMSRTDVEPVAGQDATAVEDELIRAGLDQAREDGLKVLATSPVVDEFLDDHRDDYGDLR